MKIYAKCFATLARESECDFRRDARFDVPAGITVQNFLRYVGVAREAVKIAFVNNRIVALDHALEEGDRLALAPAVGGM